MPAGVHERYRFGRFELEPRQRRVLEAGAPVPITGRAFDLLLALVERSGELVTKQELLDRVWPKLVVEESNLAVQVSALRRALGTDAIENVSGHGYRFKLDVVADEARSSRAAPPRHNLPRQLTRYIGHQSDLVACADLLDRNRLLTIIGTGGLGKTRLSLELAERWLPKVADGAWFVELAPLADRRLVLHVIAAVLGIMEQPGRPLLETILAHTSARKLLIVLDNCEHLLPACAEVARALLQGSPDLRILATSREPLHVAGEVNYPLPALSIPAGDGKMALDTLAGFESVQLFVDRATAVQPLFRLDDRNAHAVREICTRLDGIPLALELAAVRVRVMSVDLVAQRLGDRFRLLRGGDRTAPPRLQTLQATIEWSYDLLTVREQTLLQRLAVFAGGWTLETAEAICGDGDVIPAEILDLNSRLVEKSLVVVEPYGSRYKMLETIRQFALERLAASGTADPARARHLAYFVALSEETASHLVTPEETAASARLDPEWENLRTAWDFCERADGGAEAALRMVSALAAWLCRGYFDLGNPVLAKELARPAVQKRDLLRGRAAAAAGYISYYKGRYDDARRYAEEAVAIAREIGDDDLAMGALTDLGVACNGLRDYAGARPCFVEALALTHRLSPRSHRIGVLNSLAELDSLEGDLAAAEARYEEALAIAHEIGTRNFASVILINLSRIAVSRQAPVRAHERLRAALAIFEEIGSPVNAHALLSTAGAFAVLRLDWHHAARFFGSSDRRLELLGFLREPADQEALAPLLDQIRQALDAKAFASAYAEGRALSEAEAIAAMHAYMEAAP